MQNVKPVSPSDSYQGVYFKWMEEFENNHNQLRAAATEMHSKRADWLRDSRVYREIPSLLSQKTREVKQTEADQIENVIKRLEGVKGEAFKLLKHIGNAINFVKENPEESDRDTWATNLQEKHTIVRILCEDMEERMPKTEKVGTALKNILIPQPATSLTQSFYSIFWATPSSSSAQTSSISQSAPVTSSSSALQQPVTQQPEPLPVPLLSPQPEVGATSSASVIKPIERKPAPPSTPPPVKIDITDSSSSSSTSYAGSVTGKKNKGSGVPRTTTHSPGSTHHEDAKMA